MALYHWARVGKLFPRENRVGRGFIPTDAGDRVVVLSRREMASLPGRRSMSPRRVTKERHGFPPAQLMPIVNELLFPVILFLVSAGVNESLIVAVRVTSYPVHIERRQLEWSNPSQRRYISSPNCVRGRRNHSRRSMRRRRQVKCHRVCGFRRRRRLASVHVSVSLQRK